MNISGNTIFLPGGTSGIGRALALRLHEAGNKVIIGGRRTELLAEIAAENPGIESVVVDTADADSIRTAAAAVIERWPETNVLIAMAGIMLPEDFRTGGFLETAEATITTNLLGPVRLIAAFVDHFASLDEATIVTVSSGLASVPLALTPSYNATKAAIHRLSESIRLQFADTGIQVIELVPPLVRTTLLGQQDNEQAMPLDEFMDETMALLESTPDAKEVLVERVKFLRFAEVRGDYDSVVTAVNAH